jgi:hypothetical protein
LIFLLQKKWYNLQIFENAPTVVEFETCRELCDGVALVANNNTGFVQTVVSHDSKFCGTAE